MKTMETKELNGKGKIVLGRDEIYVPHLGEVLAFRLPMTTPNSFYNVRLAIDKDMSLRPTTAQAFSLIYLALQNPDDPDCKNILNGFKNYSFLTSTENLWGKKDVIVYDNVDGRMPSDRDSLLKRYRAGDKAVRVVKYGFRNEERSDRDFIKNPYVIAQVGDGAMLNVVSKASIELGTDKFCIWGFSDPLGVLNKEDFQRNTVLRKWPYRGEFVLDGSENGANVFSSGVRKTGRAA